MFTSVPHLVSSGLAINLRMQAHTMVDVFVCAVSRPVETNGDLILNACCCHNKMHWLRMH